MSHFRVSHPQVFSGITAFPRESDEEVIESVTLGMRPEWPPGVPSQWYGDTIWDQVEACWSHEPEDRPTALVVLQALQKLSEEQPQVSQESREASRDDAWDYVEDAPEPSTCGFRDGENQD